jgi:hypothetical protein
MSKHANAAHQPNSIEQRRLAWDWALPVLLLNGASLRVGVVAACVIVRIT